MDLTISEFEKGNTYEGFLLVRYAERKKDSKDHFYVDMNLGDRSGEINCKHWDPNAAAPAVGSVVRVRGTVQEFNGRLQFRIEEIRPAKKDDDVDMRLLVASAPEPAEKMRAEIRETVEGFTSGKLKKLVNEMLTDADPMLMYYPAAQRMHHAERSGLLHHTTSMLRLAKAMIPVYPFLNADLLYAGVILHDLGKIDEMKSDALGNVTDYTRDGQLLGHLVKGVAKLEKTAERLGIDDETVILLEHMLLSHHGESDYGSPKPPMFPEAEALHWLDMMDARLNTMQGVEERTRPGTFSERVTGLDRRVYHPDYDKLNP
ncbi:MAG: HD domain-containing protein [Clostridia bacterium]|nr:HD domain-containing protein [Clostridia bacterium]